MEELKLHADGAITHLESIKNVFESFKKQLNNDATLSEVEKKIKLVKARDIYLKEKKSLKNKLF